MSRTGIKWHQASKHLILCFKDIVTGREEGMNKNMVICDKRDLITLLSKSV